MESTFIHLYEKCDVLRARLWNRGLVMMISVLLFGTVASADQVTLQWDANTESDLAGYIVYWDNDQAGEPYTHTVTMTLSEDENPDLNVVEKTITGLISGTTYWFVVTAYDTENLESGYSNEVSYAANRPPVLDPIGAKNVNEGEILEFVVTATDPDGNGLTFSAGNLPSGATFDPATQTFTWNTGYGDVGNYDVLFTVTDNGVPPASDSETVTITVGNVNRPPLLDPIGSKSVDEGLTLQFVVTATDPDGNGLTFSAGNLPSGATFDPATQTFTWNTGYGDAGNYDVLFSVTDNGVPPASDSETVTMTVGNVNRPPLLDPIGSKSVDEALILEFVITATDPDGNGLTFSAGNLPSGATFDPATQTFTWDTDHGDSGNYDVLFTVDDDGVPQASDSETVTITVINVSPRPPGGLTIQ
jgi:hypothetical protein